MVDRERLRYRHRRHSKDPSVREVRLIGECRRGSVEREPPAPLVQPLLRLVLLLRARRPRVRLLLLGLGEEEVHRALPQGLQVCPGPG